MGNGRSKGKKSVHIFQHRVNKASSHQTKLGLTAWIVSTKKDYREEEN